MMLIFAIFQIRSCLKKLFSYGLEKVVKEFHSDFEK